MPNDPQATALAQRLLTIFNTGQDGQTGGTAPAGTDGHAYANSLYPNEIEYYAAALELVDGDGYTEDFFSFPVMFNTYRENQVSNTSIEKTMAGVVINANPTFVPFDIHMQGNFGRKFKKINTDIPANQPSTSSTNSTSTGTTPVVVPIFSTEYKTGYGCYKIMERMIRKSQKQDVNYKPYQLFFYNLALNSNYLVEALTLEPSQNVQSSNMIWEYNLHLKAVALASSVKKNYKSSLKLLTDFSNLTQETVFQSDQIEQYKRDRLLVDKQQSLVDEAFFLQTQSQSYGLYSNQRSAILSLLSLAASPTQNGILALAPSIGILIRY